MFKLRSNRQLEKLDDFSRYLKPRPSEAQIVMKVQPKGQTLESVLSLFKSLGISQIKYEILEKNDPSWILFHLPVEDVREVVLHLTEAGFMILKGINPAKK